MQLLANLPSRGFLDPPTLAPPPHPHVRASGDVRWLHPFSWVNDKTHAASRVVLVLDIRPAVRGWVWRPAPRPSPAVARVHGAVRFEPFSFVLPGDRGLSHYPTPARPRASCQPTLTGPGGRRHSVKQSGIAQFTSQLEKVDTALPVPTPPPRGLMPPPPPPGACAACGGTSVLKLSVA